jgi:hypothetical protein
MESGSALELALASGRLRCPACQGRLRPWGVARARAVHVLWGPDRIVQPRRARCSSCYVTHVLLPGWMLFRRAYEAATVWRVLTEHVRGLGYRRIALRMRLPETTVRDWLREFRREAPYLCDLQGAQGNSAASAVAAIESAARSEPVWQLAVRLTGGRLLRNTSPPHVAVQSASCRGR